MLHTNDLQHSKGKSGDRWSSYNQDKTSLSDIMKFPHKNNRMQTEWNRSELCIRFWRNRLQLSQNYIIPCERRSQTWQYIPNMVFINKKVRNIFLYIVRKKKKRIIWWTILWHKKKIFIWWTAQRKKPNCQKHTMQSYHKYQGGELQHINVVNVLIKTWSILNAKHDLEIADSDHLSSFSNRRLLSNTRYMIRVHTRIEAWNP